MGRGGGETAFSTNSSATALGSFGLVDTPGGRCLQFSTRVDQEIVRTPRFHVPEASPGARLDLPEHSAHHAREVLRLRSGSAIHVFDGRGHEYEGTLDQVSRQTVSVRLFGPAPARLESPLRMVLGLPPLKGDRMETAIQKATELGVAEVWPVVTARTDAAARPALHGSRQERWEKVASGAAEQCGRAVVPLVVPAMTLDELLAAKFDGLTLLFEAIPHPRPLAGFPKPTSILLLVGPPGGWEDDEFERLAAAGFEPTSLGPRILRTETAAIAAVTAAQVLWGDLG
jgi:16S rRNA (uracil1498-N3)-methyltransferase